MSELSVFEVAFAAALNEFDFIHLLVSVAVVLSPAESAHDPPKQYCISYPEVAFVLFVQPRVMLVVVWELEAKLCGGLNVRDTFVEFVQSEYWVLLGVVNVFTALILTLYCEFVVRFGMVSVCVDCPDTARVPFVAVAVSCMVVFQSFPCPFA